MFEYIPFMGSGAWVAVAVVVVAVVLMRKYSADVYDIIITRRLTTPWYRAVLSDLDTVSGWLLHVLLGHCARKRRSCELS